MIFMAGLLETEKTVQKVRYGLCACVISIVSTDFCALSVARRGGYDISRVELMRGAQGGRKE